MTTIDFVWADVQGAEDLFIAGGQNARARSPQLCQALRLLSAAQKRNPAAATAAQASPYIRYLAPKLVRRGALSRVVHAALGPVNSTAHQC